jgi:exodeoxyribonuclease VII large subunit
VKNDGFLTVSQLNTLVKDKFDQEPLFSHIVVEGEISSYKAYDSAIYFEIKDAKSVLPCIMWGDDAIYLAFEPKLGDQVVLEGRLAVYTPKGRYQFYAKSISLAGAGLALLKLQQLKEKLEKEGLFSLDRKRSIPSFPNAIGIVTGDNSAAEADLIKNISRRWPVAKIMVFPSLVQGKDAPKDICRALKLAYQYPLDTLIIARGGGSGEDLSAFNDEELVRLVSKSPIPTISAIGHEIDFTLVDYVADVRVSTPTGAAEKATPALEDILQILFESQDSLSKAIHNKITLCENSLEALANRPFFKSPENLYSYDEEKVDALKERLSLSFKNYFSSLEASLKGSEQHLKALSPYATLNRGYSITVDEKGQALNSTKNVKEGMLLKTRLKDGIILSKVEGKENGKN